MNKAPDFVAELYYLTPKEGGRKTPAFSGYRPLIKFPFSDKLTSGQQLFLNREKVGPGEMVVAEIRMASPHFFEKQLEVGMDFEAMESPSNIVAKGRIIEIVNSVLIKES